MQKQKYKTECEIKQKNVERLKRKEKFINPKQRKSRIMRKSKRA